MKSIKFIFLIILLVLMTEIFTKKHKHTKQAPAAPAAGASAGADMLPDEPCGYKYVFNRAVRKCVKASGRRRRGGDVIPVNPIAVPVVVVPKLKKSNVLKRAKPAVAPEHEEVHPVTKKNKKRKSIDWDPALVAADNKKIATIAK
jgi:hypothetical protein